MSEAREAILASVRAALKRDASSTGAPAPPRHTRPAFSEDAAERLQRQLERHAATVERLASAAELPAAVMRYLVQHALPARIACAPALRELPWPPALALHAGPARRDEGAAVTPCFAGVAETGSLVLVSGPETPTTLNFVPEHHLVVLRRAQIVRHFEDAWELLRRRYLDRGGMPRAVNVISGPSRTADVEQTIQLGIHGPRRLHVFLVDD